MQFFGGGSFILYIQGLKPIKRHSATILKKSCSEYEAIVDYKAGSSSQSLYLISHGCKYVLMNLAQEDSLEL